MRLLARSLPAGLLWTGFLVAPSHAYAQVEPPKQEPDRSRSDQTDPTRLPLRLAASSTWTFDVQRGAADPLGADAAAAEPDPFAKLRYALRSERAAEDGQSLLMVEIQPSGLTGEESPALATFRAHVDPEGRVLRIKQVREQGAPADPVAGGLEPGRVQADLERILGTGLHEAALEQGERYRLGAEVDADARPVEAASAAAGLQEAGAHDAELRFDGVRAAGTGRAATFTILPAQPAASSDGAQDDEPERGVGDGSSRGQVGMAAYSLKDGLVNTFELRPRASATDAAGTADPLGLAWVTIQRVRQAD